MGITRLKQHSVIHCDRPDKLPFRIAHSPYTKAMSTTGYSASHSCKKSGRSSPHKKTIALVWEFLHPSLSGVTVNTPPAPIRFS
ncbi:hypothetical protein [aff. Roholtiella sp. LEGE 12411]|uniref:hypothetical protein n=1 Tax=aff. Roholtiella sp. LEGE 12411 TaxID=1828822 RepID=UPI0018821C91|nr:hypothetical protein [aff. Roholtiella sp. LEGE 12411]MBE9038514.1 hypothetical protein [aff. Roholtiella sp. LEGE 12411]